MKTRNQLNTKVVLEANDNEMTKHEQANAPQESPSRRSPLPPRLRDRRSFSIERKLHHHQQQHDSSSTTPSSNPKQASSPSANVKRLSGPTRILPKRSCAATSLLLSSYITASISHNRAQKQTTCKSPDVSNTSLGKVTQDCKQPVTSSLRAQQSNEDVCSTTLDNEMIAINMKTANTRNYSKDAPSVRSTDLPKPTKSATDSLLKSNVTKTPKLVRISLPDKNTSLNTSSPIALASSSKQTDKNRYMFTMNGLRKIDFVGLEKNNNEIATLSANSFDETIPISNESGQVPTSILVKRKTFNVLIAVTGSVATIKLAELTRKIKSTFPQIYTEKTIGDKMEAHADIKIVMTKNSTHFASKKQIQTELADLGINEIFEDSDEWSSWKKMGDPVLHIELRKWADLCLIAPLDANTMAKLANGICDNLLTCIVRAWDVSKPLIYCPAMNVHMYNHPITREQLSKLQSFNYVRVDCVEKRLACGDVGMGGMATVDTIAKKVVECLIQPNSQRPVTRPLLNQQPTYPIISTSDHCDKVPNNSISRAAMPTMAGSLFERFQTNLRKFNQISIHAVPPPNNVQPSISSVSKHKRKLDSSSSDDNFFPQPYTIYKRSTNCSSSINQTNLVNNGKNKMGGVTSVQNLKAIGVDNSTMEKLRESMNDVEPKFDLDPTKILEQSMVTDDYASSSAQIDDFETNLNLVRPSSRQAGNLTPLLNTSKFLALCFNKERGDFTCAICKHDYKNRKSMARHLKEQHVQGNIFQCKPCGVSYKRREKLIKHNRERHPERIQ